MSKTCCDKQLLHSQVRGCKLQLVTHECEGLCVPYACVPAFLNDILLWIVPDMTPCPISDALQAFFVFAPGDTFSEAVHLTTLKLHDRLTCAGSLWVDEACGQFTSVKFNIARRTPAHTSGSSH